MCRRNFLEISLKHTETVCTLSPLFPVIRPILRETVLTGVAFQRKMWFTFSAFKEMHSGSGLKL